MFSSIFDQAYEVGNESASYEIRMKGEIIISDLERSETASYDARACAACQGSRSGENNSNIPIGKQVR